MTVDDREAIAVLVAEVGLSEAADRMGVSVSYLLKVAPELKTERQHHFDAREAAYIEFSGGSRGDRPAKEE